MTTAYNFPDLDISPINNLSELSLINMHNLSDSNVEITPPPDYEKARNRGNSSSKSRVEETEHTIDIEISLDSLAPLRGAVPTTYDENDTANYSSEDVFQRLEKEAKRDILATQSSDDEIDGSCMSNTILHGVVAFVDFKCCLESARTVKSKLRQMGGLVVRRMSPGVTHVIFSRGGNKCTLQAALSMENKPFLLDPHWVHSCYFNQCRVPEESYNLYEGKYLVDAIQRLSSAAQEKGNDNSLDHIELSPQDDLEPRITNSVPRSRSSVSLSDFGEMTFDKPLTASQLLTKIDKLSKRLDNLASNDDVAALTHGNRCPSRIGLCENPSPMKTTGTNTENFVSKCGLPLRRRSHGAFGLAHRAPYSSAVQAMVAIREEANAENGISDITNRLDNVALAKKAFLHGDGIEDMQKASQPTLNQIHNRLKNNSRFRNKKSTKPTNDPPMPAICESFDDTDESLLRTPTASAVRPIVNTASTVINRLQNIPSSDEFAEKGSSRLKKRGVVFTGFNRQEEDFLKNVVEDLEMKVQTTIDQGTRCVISLRGQRTLTTLRAIILGVPVVKPEWLSACERENKLVSIKKYLYPQWHNPLRTQKSTLFARLGSILVIDGCSPPAEDLKWMIKKCGGLASCANNSDLLVSPANKVVQVPWTRSNRDPPLVVSEKYILDCITENKILCIADYAEVSVSVVDE